MITTLNSTFISDEDGILAVIEELKSKVGTHVFTLDYHVNPELYFVKALSIWFKSYNSDYRYPALHISTKSCLNLKIGKDLVHCFYIEDSILKYNQHPYLNCPHNLDDYEEE